MDSFISIINYDLMRADSLSDLRKHGIAMYIKNYFKYEILQVDVSNVVANFISYGFNVVTVYSPPSNSTYINNILLNLLCNFCNDKEVVVQGDFNLPSIHWNLEDIFSVYVAPLDLEFLYIFISLVVHGQDDFRSSC